MRSNTIRDRVRAIERARSALEREEERHERQSHRRNQRLLALQSQCIHPNLEEDRDAWSTTYRCPDCTAVWHEPLPPEVRAAHIRTRHAEWDRRERELQARLQRAQTTRARKRIGEASARIFNARHALMNVCPHIHKRDEQGLYGQYQWCEDCRWSNGL